MDQGRTSALHAGQLFQLLERGRAFGQLLLGRRGIQHGLERGLKERGVRAVAAFPDQPLSPREREVLECVLRNLSNKEIGARLNVSERTVKYHVSALLAKFNVRDRVSLMREATSGLRTSSFSSSVDTLFGFPLPSQPKVAESAPEPKTLPKQPAVGDRVTPRRES